MKIRLGPWILLGLVCARAWLPAPVAQAADSRQVAALSARVFGTDPTEPYPVRLQAVRELGARFPGRVSPVGFQYREMGLFAGIYMQTLWQHESGRDELPIWYLVNRNLNLVPRVYMSEYEANPDLPYEQSPYVLANPTYGGVSAPVTHVDTCRAWKEYFKAADRAKKDAASWNPLVKLRGELAMRTTVTRLLWHAHTTGIRQALWHNQELFGATGIPEDELAFWRGWIRVVFFSEKIAPATTDLLLKPLLTASMPTCSPLGGTGCLTEDQPLLRREFLEWLMRGRVDQHEFLQVFGGKPVAGQSLARSIHLLPLRDEAVSAAVRAGLSGEHIALDPRDEQLLDAVVAKVRARSKR